MTANSESETEARLARWDRPLALALLGLPALVVLAATFVSSGATRIYTWPWAFYVQVALLAPWLWCAWSVTRGRTGLREGWWIALPLLTALVLSIMTSAHWHDALEASLPLATPLILLPFAAQHWREASAKHRLLALRSAGAVFGLLALTSLSMRLHQAPGTGVLAWLISTRNPHPLGHWNYTGGLALLALPILILLAWREKGGLRATWAIASCAAGIQFLSAGSRGAVLGLLAGALTVVLALTARRRLAARTAVLGATAVLALGAVTVASNPRLRAAFADPTSVLRAGESEQQRLGFLLTGIEIAKAHPWTGIGPGTTPYHYPEHRVDRAGSLENAFQLHCGPLQWWVDTGVVGLAALVLAASTLKLRAWRARRDLSAASVASLALLAGYGVMWLTDYQLDAPFFPVVLGLAASLLVAESASTPTPSTTSWARMGPILAIPALGCAILLAGSWQARAAFAGAWSAKDANDINGFIKHLRDAASAAPWQPCYQNHFARALAGVAAHLPPETAGALRDEARTAWERSLAAAPAQDHPWLNLGWLALADDRASTAVESFEKAAAIQPRRGGLWFATAVAHLALGSDERAATALAREIRLDPSFILSPLWREEAFVALQSTVIERLGRGWPRADQDPGATGDAAIAAFARWWWTGESPTESTPSREATLSRILGSMARIDDRTAALEPHVLPPALAALRASWQTGGPVDSALIRPDLAAAWTSHRKSHPDAPFSELLRTLPATTVRRIVRGADGIVFRQLDGDPLSDLTEIPASALAAALTPLLPRPALGEFLDHAD